MGSVIDVPQRPPRDLLHHFAAAQMQQSLLHIQQPEAPVDSLGHFLDPGARDGGHCKEPAVLPPRKASAGGDPDSPAAVFQQGMDRVVRQAVVLAVDPDLSAVPPAKTSKTTEPYGPVACRQHCADKIANETLLRRHGRDGEVPKTVHPPAGADPDTALPILEECIDEIARQSVGSLECVGPSPVYMLKAPIHGPDPEAPLAVAQQP